MRIPLFFLLALLPLSASAHFAPTIPIGLFSDPGFWIFFTWNVLLFIAVVWFALLPNWKARRPEIASNLPLAVTVIFSLLLLLQIFHDIEHIAQLYQFSHLRLPAKESGGILWFLDVEWNHFLFNLFYLAGLLYVAMHIRRALSMHGRRLSSVDLLLLIALVVPEAWHLVEHSVRIVEHVVTGCQPCKGIADRAFGVTLISLHFAYNFIALAFPLLVFFWYGFHWRFFGKRNHPPTPRATLS